MPFECSVTHVSTESLDIINHAFLWSATLVTTESLDVITQRVATFFLYCRVFVTRCGVWVCNWIYWTLKLIITKNYNATAKSHSVQFITAHTKSSQSVVSSWLSPGNCFQRCRFLSFCLCWLVPASQLIPWLPATSGLHWPPIIITS